VLGEKRGALDGSSHRMKRSKDETASSPSWSIRTERQPWLNFLYTFAFGASRPFPSVVAKVALPNRQRAFSRRSGNWRSCPIANLDRGGGNGCPGGARTSWARSSRSGRVDEASKVMPQLDRWQFTLATACDVYRTIKTCPAPGKIVVDVDLLVLSPARKTAQRE